MVNVSVNSFVDGLSLAGSIWRHPGNRSRRARGLAGFVAWQFVKHVLKRPVEIRFHNQRLKCYPDSTSTSVLHAQCPRCSGVFEPVRRCFLLAGPAQIHRVLAISVLHHAAVDARLQRRLAIAL
jgi:hypothetical protein